MFTETDQVELPRGQLRSLQVVVASLAMSVVAFLVVLALVPLRPADVTSEPGEPADLSLLTYAALGVALLALPGGPFLARCVANVAARRWIARVSRDNPSGTGTPEARLRQRRAVVEGLVRICGLRILIGSALHEAAGMLLAVSYYLDGHVISLLVGGLLVFCILLQVPTGYRTSQWIEEQLCSANQTL